MLFWEEKALEIFQDPRVDELLCNGRNGIQLVQGETTKCYPFPCESQVFLQRSLQDLAFAQGLRLDPLQPSAGGLLSLGEGEQLIHLRWHALLPPVARDGPLLSLRRQRLGFLQMHEFCDENFSRVINELMAVTRPVLVIGPTGSGKTSFLITLLNDHAASKRVAVLEQVPEIPALSANWIRFAAQRRDLTGQGEMSLEHVFDELLRMRPDQIVIGEIRSDESRALRRALLAGEGAVWTTLHSRGPKQICFRLSDLSGDSPGFWQTHLADFGTICFVMQREKPRLCEAWLLTSEGWELIFSAARGKAQTEFS